MNGWLASGAGLSLVASCQGGSATIDRVYTMPVVGYVRDANGASLPGAVVEVSTLN
jgi:hypothetical protein